jgi:hypothetical protein
VLGTGLKGISTKGAPYIAGFGSPRHIGQLFLTTYLFPFEVASLLLLVAAMGAIVLARRRRGLEQHDEDLELRIRAPRPLYTGTMAEAAGVSRGLSAAEEEAPEPVAEVVSAHGGAGEGSVSGEGADRP